MFYARRRTDRRLQDLEIEVDELREENARLRAEQQRPLDPHALAAQLDDASRALALKQAPAGEDGAEQRQALLDIAVTREGLLEVCTQLQALAGQMHRQLTGGTPPAEIDRRVVQVEVAHDRRRPTRDADRRRATEDALREIVTMAHGKDPVPTARRNGSGPTPGGGGGRR